MKTNSYLFTSESVSAGHPDKIADQISDAILDAYLRLDKEAKVACECLITTNYCCIAGEITSTAKVDALAIAKEVIREIGYNNEEIGFDYKTARFEILLHTQSPEINKSVSNGGAGDQGIMFGYACRETEELMPLPIVLSHRLMQRHHELRSHPEFNWLLPDAKAQVTIRYESDEKPVVDTVVLSTQHSAKISQEELHQAVKKHIIDPVIKDHLGKCAPTFHINPSGSFTIGGPHGDTGLTGRKIVVDTYGGKCPHGGGAFSGKDPSKVDRSAAYMARFVAKHIVAAGLAKECTVQIAYAIGHNQPVSLLVDVHSSGRWPNSIITKFANICFDLSPDGIAAKLNLKQPIYRKTAVFGHLGNPEFTWEIIHEDLISALKDEEATHLNAHLKVLGRPSDNQRILTYKQELKRYTEEQLIAIHNMQRKNRLAGTSALVGKALHEEMLSRELNCDVITDRNKDGKVAGYLYSAHIEIEIHDGKKSIVIVKEN